MYLFGASPALDRAVSCAAARTRSKRFDADTLVPAVRHQPAHERPRLPEQSAQSALLPATTTLDGYLDVLAKAVNQPYPPYEAIGTQHDGEWVQLNTNVLQIENEFYSTIRPKRVTHRASGRCRRCAARGVQYIEVRCLDVDPFEPVGISLETSASWTPSCCSARSRTARCCRRTRAPKPTTTSPRHEGRPQAGPDAGARRPRSADEGLGRRTARARSSRRRRRSMRSAAATNTCARSTVQRARLADVSLTPSARVLANHARASSRASTISRLDHQRSARGILPQSRPLPTQRQSAEFEELAAKSLAEQTAHRTRGSRFVRRLCRRLSGLHAEPLQRLNDERAM